MVLSHPDSYVEKEHGHVIVHIPPTIHLDPFGLCFFNHDRSDGRKNHQNMARPSSGLIVCDETVGDYALTGLSESFRIPMSKHALNSTFDSFSPKRKQTMRFRRWVLHVLMYGNNISMHSLWAMNRNFTYPNLPKSLHVPVTEPSRVWAIDSWLAVIVASALQALVDGRNPKSPTCRGTP